MMISQFSLYYFVAISLQFLVLALMKKKQMKTRYLYALVSLFIAQNSTLVGMHLTSIGCLDILNAEILLRLFYATSSFSVACFLSYAIEISVTKRNRFIRQIESGVWTVAICNAILVCFTNEIVNGHEPRSYTFTAIQGNIYWLFKTHAIMGLLTAGVLLVREYRYLRDRFKKTYSLLILVAYLSMIISILVISWMMNYGAKINLDTSFAFFSTFSLGLIVYSNLKYSGNANLVLEKTPRKVSDSDQLLEIFNKYVEGEHSYAQASEKFDFLLLSYAYNKHKGNMVKTATSIGLGRSTLYKKVQKHKLR